MKRMLSGIALIALVATGCASSARRAQGSGDVLRLGIFPNLTHAPGYVALEGGILEDALAPAKVDVKYFNSGTDAGNALLGGSIDATYIGPGPAINLFLKSDGKVRVVSGVTSGGASLVVRKGANINGPQDLKGKKVAVPGIGNTQDVALRSWLAEEGLEGRNTEGGDVLIVEVANPQLPQLFASGELDAAWEPEPYPSLLVEQGVAEPFLEEAELWPGGEFVTTHLLVSTGYLDAHKDVVSKLVKANVEAIELINEDPDRAKSLAAAGLKKAEAPQLPEAVVDAAWDKLTFTWDPVQASLQQDAEDAFALETLEENPTSILDVYQLDLLNAALTQLQLPLIEVLV